MPEIRIPSRRQSPKPSRNLLGGLLCDNLSVMAACIGLMICFGLCGQSCFASRRIFQSVDYHSIVPQVKWSPFQNGQNCLQFIDEEISPCLHKMFLVSNVTVTTHSFSEFFQLRNLTAKVVGNCENFVVSSNLTRIERIFQGNKQPGQRWNSPFSSIFIVRGSADLEEEIPLEFSQTVLEYIYNETLNVFVIETRSAESSCVQLMTLKNVLTRKSIVLSEGQDLTKFYGLKTSHPFLNVSDVHKQLTASFYNCSPYIFQSTDGKLDGIEYRFINEIAKNWKIKFDQRFLNGSHNIYDGMFSDLSKRSIDVVMCSVWITETHNKVVALSKYFDWQCITLLCPIPIQLPDATIIYRTLSSATWFTFLSAFLLTGLALAFVARFQHHSNAGRSYHSIVRCFLDVARISTSQGLGCLPKSNLLKMILSSWLLASLAIGMSYSTGYTSLLTRPAYEAPVNTVKDFLESDYNWVDGSFNRPWRIWMEPLRKSGVTIYEEVVERYVPLSHYTRNQNQQRKLAFFTKFLHQKFLTDIIWSESFTSLRPMKSCILTNFAGFAFSKKSAYQQFFDSNIGRFEESGIIDHWFQEMSQDPDMTYMRQVIANEHLNRPFERHALSLMNVSGAFYLIGFGWLVSTIAFVSEAVIFKLFKR